MIERSYDAVRINEIVNHPDVRPFIGPGDALDLTPLVERPENWFVMGEYGGFALIWSAPKVHEIHTFILPEGRGLWARKAAKEIVAFASKNGDTMIWTKVPPDQKNVEVYTRMAGLKSADMTVDTFGKAYKIFYLELNKCQ